MSQAPGPSTEPMHDDYAARAPEYDCTFAARRWRCVLDVRAQVACHLLSPE